MVWRYELAGLARLVREGYGDVDRELEVMLERADHPTGRPVENWPRRRP